MGNVGSVPSIAREDFSLRTKGLVGLLFSLEMTRFYGITGGRVVGDFSPGAPVVASREK